MKNKFILVLCIIFGLLTSYLIYDYLTKAERSMSNIQYGQVIVTAVNVPAKTMLTNEMLTVKKVPLEYIHPQTIQKKEEAVGTITVTPLVQGEYVLHGRIAQRNDAKNGLAYIVPAGKRAVTVAVDQVSGVAGLLKPGDHVDVAATVNIPDGQREIPFSLVVLQDIQILAVDRNLEDKEIPPENKTVTLAVTVEQSRPLILASQKGNIRLLLRSPADSSTVYTVPFRAEDFKQ